MSLTFIFLHCSNQELNETWPYICALLVVYVNHSYSWFYMCHSHVDYNIFNMKCSPHNIDNLRLEWKWIHPHQILNAIGLVRCRRTIHYHLVCANLGIWPNQMVQSPSQINHPQTCFCQVLFGEYASLAYLTLDWVSCHSWSIEYINKNCSKIEGIFKPNSVYQGFNMPVVGPDVLLGLW